MAYDSLATATNTQQSQQKSLFSTLEMNPAQASEYHPTIMMYDPTMDDDCNSIIDDGESLKERRLSALSDNDGVGISYCHDRDEVRDINPSSTDDTRHRLHLTREDPNETVIAVEDLDLLEWYKISGHTQSTEFSTSSCCSSQTSFLAIDPIRKEERNAAAKISSAKDDKDLEEHIFWQDRYSKRSITRRFGKTFQSF